MKCRWEKWVFTQECGLECTFTNKLKNLKVTVIAKKKKKGEIF